MFKIGQLVKLNEFARGEWPDGFLVMTEACALEGARRCNVSIPVEAACLIVKIDINFLGESLVLLFRDTLVRTSADYVELWV